VADDVTDRLMAEYPIRWIEVTVRKFILADAEWVAVFRRRD